METTSQQSQNAALNSDWSVFAHLSAEKAPLYRQILKVFVEAKTSFTLHLRPVDVRDLLNEVALPDKSDLGGFESELSQLCAWGNLEAHEDRSDVIRVEDFYKRRFLYQLTAEGEAVERALEFFHDAIHQPGELQTVTLFEIRQYLGELLEISKAPKLDEGRAVLVLQTLADRFAQLTTRAQMFLRSLQHRIDFQESAMEEFLLYKQNLIDYLERFIGQLILATHEIAGRLEEIEVHGIFRILEAAAHRDAIDAMEHEKERRLSERLHHWQGRWAGLKGWFLGNSGRPSQAEMLRTRARAAIPALLGAVARINDRRIARSDRVADLQTLARWFAQASTEDTAHRLWRSAFCMSPSRHLKVDDETLDHREQNPVSPQTSWLEADPVHLAPRIRQFGRHVAKGAARKVIDRTAEKEQLAQIALREALQIEEAQKRLATGRRMKLSEIGILDKPAEFDLLLDLLGEALATKTKIDEITSAVSTDGSLNIVLEPSDDHRKVALQTSEGEFVGEDHYVTISSRFED